MQGKLPGLDLFLAHAEAHALVTQLHTLLGQHLLHHLALLGRQILHLFEHLLHVRQRLAIDLHGARADLPQTRPDSLRRGQDGQQTQGQGQAFQY
ncbi:hypothetical protein D3C71_1713430 [compost metagenome]